ncbi:MAG: TIGR01777 family oxidoreductase [bacterium]
MKVGVTGATGGIGHRLCLALIERGHQVVLISRRPAEAKSAIPQALNALGWHQLKPSSVAPGIAALDAVVHLAGDVVAGRWSPEKKKRIRDSRVNTAKQIVEAIHAAHQRPKALITASAIGHYGDRGDETVTEDSPPGSDFLSKTCVEWESASRAAEPLGVRVVAVRTGIVLDPQIGALKAMLLPFRLGLGGPLGSGRQWMSWVHIDDVIGIFLHALEIESVTGALNATAPNPVRNLEFTKALGKVLHRPAFLAAPAFALKLFFGEFSCFLLSGQRVLPERTQQSGYAFKHSDLDPALHSLLL